MKQKYLLWTLHDLLDMLNGCAVTGIQTEDSFIAWRVYLEGLTEG